MTAVSWASSVSSPCDRCGTSNEEQIWMVVSAVDQPDVIDRLRDGHGPGLDCRACHHHSPLDTPMLIHRPEQGGLAGLLFVPSYGMTEEQSATLAEGLVAVLFGNLGIDGTNVATRVFTVSRLNLPAVLRRDVRRDLAVPAHRLRLPSNLSEGYRQLLTHLRR